VIRQLDSSDAEFDTLLTALLSFPEEDQAEVRSVVAGIIKDVRDRGDIALVELTNQFDRQSAEDMTSLQISPTRLAAAFDAISPLVRDALIESADRVRRYHEQQLSAMGAGDDWQFTDELGNTLGQKVKAMSRVGIYVPGGKAAYPSTIIMTAVPAKVAGVEEIVLCVPTPGGELNDVLLAAAHLCGVDHVFTVGGAQAIAAMAYGTISVPKVDKIVGPGNVYVATAKELVFGDVGIDMIAGPSEVVIVADDSADPDWVVQDMFAQAEHDEMAQAIVISPSAQLLQKVKALIPVKLGEQTRSSIIDVAIDQRAALIRVENLDDAFDLVNRIAPEHLQIALEAPEQYLEKVHHAGAVFLGADTAEVVGDYSAGPSHVLPTGGTARFASPLGVYDFQTRTSVIHCSPRGAIVLNRAAAILAREEGLDAHAESALSRVKG
jgi:histidinol dehydrogenase